MDWVSWQQDVRAGLVFKIQLKPQMPNQYVTVPSGNSIEAEKCKT
jgi:hypothetical protein